MSLSIDDLRVVYEVLDSEGRNVRDMIGRPATVADLIEIAKSLPGAVVQEVKKREFRFDPEQPERVARVLSPLWPRKGAGRYLVIPLSYDCWCGSRHAVPPTEWHGDTEEKP